MKPDSTESQPSPDLHEKPTSGEEPVSSSSARKKIQISINAPFILAFAGLGLVAMILHAFTGGQSTSYFFELGGTFQFSDPSFYLKWLLHPLGHASWTHYFGNFTLILLVGPLLEEKYGRPFLISATLLTALVTGFFHVLFFNSGLVGASGIAFMMILLTSQANFKKNTIPLTFLIVGILFMGREIAASFQQDDISQFAHIIGGLCGAAFGFWWNNRKAAKAA